jgi:hypothetical protein
MNTCFTRWKLPDTVSWFRYQQLYEENKNPFPSANLLQNIALDYVYRQYVEWYRVYYWSVLCSELCLPTGPEAQCSNRQEREEYEDTSRSKFPNLDGFYVPHLVEPTVNLEATSADFAKPKPQPKKQKKPKAKRPMSVTEKKEDVQVKEPKCQSEAEGETKTKNRRARRLEKHLAEAIALSLKINDGDSRSTHSVTSADSQTLPTSTNSAAPSGSSSNLDHKHSFKAHQTKKDKIRKCLAFPETSSLENSSLKTSSPEKVARPEPPTEIPLKEFKIQKDFKQPETHALLQTVHPLEVIPDEETVTAILGASRSVIMQLISLFQETNQETLSPFLRLDLNNLFIIKHHVSRRLPKGQPFFLTFEFVSDSILHQQRSTVSATQTTVQGTKNVLPVWQELYAQVVQWFRRRRNQSDFVDHSLLLTANIVSMIFAGTPTHPRLSDVLRYEPTRLRPTKFFSVVQSVVPSVDILNQPDRMKLLMKQSHVVNLTSLDPSTKIAKKDVEASAFAFLGICKSGRKFTVLRCESPDSELLQCVNCRDTIMAEEPHHRLCSICTQAVCNRCHENMKNGKITKCSHDAIACLFFQSEFITAEKLLNGGTTVRCFTCGNTEQILYENRQLMAAYVYGSMGCFSTYLTQLFGFNPTHNAFIYSLCQKHLVSPDLFSVAQTIIDYCGQLQFLDAPIVQQYLNQPRDEQPAPLTALQVQRMFLTDMILPFVVRNGLNLASSVQKLVVTDYVLRTAESLRCPRCKRATYCSPKCLHFDTLRHLAFECC